MGTLHTEHYILILFALWMLWVSCLASRAKSKANENRSMYNSLRNKTSDNDAHCHRRMSKIHINIQQEVTKLQDAIDTRMKHKAQGMDKMWDKIYQTINAMEHTIDGKIILDTCECSLCGRQVSKDLKVPRQSKDVDCKGCGSKVRVQGAV